MSASLRERTPITSEFTYGMSKDSCPVDSYTSGDRRPAWLKAASWFKNTGKTYEDFLAWVYSADRGSKDMAKWTRKQVDAHARSMWNYFEKTHDPSFCRAGTSASSPEARKVLNPREVRDLLHAMGMVEYSWEDLAVRKGWITPDGYLDESKTETHEEVLRSVSRSTRSQVKVCNPYLYLKFQNLKDYQSFEAPPFRMDSDFTLGRVFDTSIRDYLLDNARKTVTRAKTQERIADDQHAVYTLFAGKKAYHVANKKTLKVKGKEVNTGIDPTHVNFSQVLAALASKELGIRNIRARLKELQDLSLIGLAVSSVYQGRAWNWVGNTFSRHFFLNLDILPKLLSYVPNAQKRKWYQDFKLSRHLFTSPSGSEDIIESLIQAQLRKADRALALLALRRAVLRGSGLSTDSASVSRGVSTLSTRTEYPYYTTYRGSISTLSTVGGTSTSSTTPTTTLLYTQSYTPVFKGQDSYGQHSRPILRRRSEAVPTVLPGWAPTPSEVISRGRKEVAPVPPEIAQARTAFRNWLTQAIKEKAEALRKDPEAPVTLPEPPKALGKRALKLMEEEKTWQKAMALLDSTSPKDCAEGARLRIEIRKRREVRRKAQERRLQKKARDAAYEKWRQEELIPYQEALSWHKAHLKGRCRPGERLFYLDASGKKVMRTLVPPVLQEFIPPTSP